MKVSYHIDAPVEAVFDYFKDPTADAGFGMEVLEARMTEEGVGSYVNWRVRIAGVGLQGLDVLTDVEPNKHITELSSSAWVGTWEYTFEPEGPGTKVTLEHRPRSLWAAPIVRTLVDFGTTRLTGLYIRRVKAKLEGTPRPEREGAVPRTAGSDR